MDVDNVFDLEKGSGDIIAEDPRIVIAQQRKPRRCSSRTKLKFAIVLIILLLGALLILAAGLIGVQQSLKEKQ